MRFGLSPVENLLLADLDPLAMGIVTEVSATLDIFDPSGRSSKKVRDTRQFPCQHPCFAADEPP